MTIATGARSPKVLLLDIEGTVAPASYVYDVLFPYARKHAAAFLREHWQDPAVQQDVALLRRLAEDDLLAGAPGAVPIAPLQAGPEELQRSIVRNVHWQMDHDRKTIALKSLQGKIWRLGYERGELRSVVFDDVPVALRQWRTEGRHIYIYSSGSIEAQQLFFRHCEQGDLTPLLAGYFDPTTGPKREPASYAAIAEATGTHPSEIVFATDLMAEAVAAAEAGLGVVVVDRPGNQPQPPHSFRIVTDLYAIV